MKSTDADQILGILADFSRDLEQLNTFRNEITRLIMEEVRKEGIEVVNGMQYTDLLTQLLATLRAKKDKLPTEE